MSKDPGSQFVIVPLPFAKFIVLTVALVKFLERRKYSADFFHLLVIAGNIITVNFSVAMIQFTVVGIGIVGAHEAKSDAGDNFLRQVLGRKRNIIRHRDIHSPLMADFRFILCQNRLCHVAIQIECFVIVDVNARFRISCLGNKGE